MKIVISGASGLIGSALIPFLKSKGHTVAGLVRSKAGITDILWNPDQRGLEPSYLEGFDAVIHLAGESITAGRWTPAKKERILKSRVEVTQLLSETLARLKEPPHVFLSASAIGYYGNRGSEILKEGSLPGNSFLPKVCKAWEAATFPAIQRGIRTVHLRFGVVLSESGGALAKMIPPFKMGLGGRIGPGTQYLSWVTLDDVLGAILHILQATSLKGPVNVTAPTPVTNEQFTRTLGKVLSRPTFLPLPAFAARLLFGEMADELLLASTRVEPAALRLSTYHFRYPDLESALQHLLN